MNIVVEYYFFQNLPAYVNGFRDYESRVAAMREIPERWDTFASQCKTKLWYRAFYKMPLGVYQKTSMPAELNLLYEIFCEVSGGTRVFYQDRFVPILYGDEDCQEGLVWKRDYEWFRIKPSYPTIINANGHTLAVRGTWWELYRGAR